MPWPTRECHPLVVCRESPPWVMLCAPWPPPAISSGWIQTLTCDAMELKRNAIVASPRNVCCLRARRCPFATFIVCPSTHFYSHFAGSTETFHWEYSFSLLFSLKDPMTFEVKFLWSDDNYFSIIRFFT